MTRQIFDQTKCHPSIQDEIGGSAEYRKTVDEVIAAINKHTVVIVGMRQNPFPKQAKKLLDEKGIEYCYLEYGSYFNGWKPRGALKMWTGWQTFPMIFVRGQFVGGKQDLEKLMKSGELAKMLVNPAMK